MSSTSEQPEKDSDVELAELNEVELLELSVREFKKQVENLSDDERQALLEAEKNGKNRKSVIELLK